MDIADKHTISISSWENGDDWETDYTPKEMIPLVDDPIDNYRRGHISFGKCPKRGNAIMMARMRKRFDKNMEYFCQTILPKIEKYFFPGDWKELGDILQKEEYIRKGGFVKVIRESDGLFAWVHPTEKEKIDKAKELGYIIS